MYTCTHIAIVKFVCSIVYLCVYHSYLHNWFWAKRCEFTNAQDSLYDIYNQWYKHVYIPSLIPMGSPPCEGMLICWPLYPIEISKLPRVGRWEACGWGYIAHFIVCTISASWLRALTCTCYCVCNCLYWWLAKIMQKILSMKWWIAKQLWCHQHVSSLESEGVASTNQPIKFDFNMTDKHWAKFSSPYSVFSSVPPSDAIVSYVCAKSTNRISIGTPLLAGSPSYTIKSDVAKRRSDVCVRNHWRNSSSFFSTAGMTSTRFTSPQTKKFLTAVEEKWDNYYWMHP